MPLSDREQQLLDQIEQALYAEDPKFATTVRSARPRSHARRWLVLCLFGVVGGLAIVLAGLAAKLIVLGVLGFVLIVASCVYATTLLTARNAAPPTASNQANSNTARKDGVRSRMEDRLKRRFDEN
ncbi:hypothetical protein SAMN05892883_3523 [Jatrophihabitans sp. GAS493]|uniref:DUF3040 domain-containing protein n=1 Tax=Jatrophihabitans sp. GAS493 TaxID=1907575 RepID=UPI000BBF738D|nr:DUF3040 domain-containing protein [Jatrophihabitans sp. GAS493]SOD74339.1 hypothetical protein SAMN05892883_3523 [Jatrophihabitans sp. GAS493]